MSRSPTTLRLAAAEIERLEEAARRLHLDRTAFVRAAALGAAELVLERGSPLVLAVEPETLLRRMAALVRSRRGEEES